jgi:hypothetical protein
MAQIIPIKSPMKIQKKCLCSFCGETRICVQSIISGKSICFLCQQNAKEILSRIPAGAICCLSCQKHDHIVVEMDNKSLVHYKSPTLDIKGLTIYTVSKFFGNYKDNTKRSQAWCGYCKTEIPLYLLSRSDYIL